MFGGIINHSGIVRDYSGNQKDGMVLILETPIAPQVKIGDSVGVNGVCLTVTKQLNNNQLAFDVWPESLQRTTLTSLNKEQIVQVDLPLQAGDFIGGHPVLGHVDYVGTILSMSTVEEANQLKIWINLPSEYAALVPARGSIAVDGVSLTVTGRSKDSFAVSLIPETLRLTQLDKLITGDHVNIEVDYAARSLQDETGMLNLATTQEEISSTNTLLDQVLTQYKSGGLALIHQDNRFILVGSCEKINESTLTFALGMSRTPCTIAITEGIAETLFIPAPIINGKAGKRRYLLPLTHKENEPYDLSASAILKTFTIFCDDDKGIDHWMTPGNVQSIQVHSANDSDTPGLPEAAVALAFKANLSHSTLCQTMLDASGKHMNPAQAEAFATRFQIPLIPVEDIITSNNELFEVNCFNDL